VGKAVDDLREQKKRGETLSSINAEPKNVKYMITENQYLR
jgi:hypothetical protein